MQISDILASLNCNIETTVSNFYRKGNYTLNKKRPVVIKINSIWNKRKILAEYKSLSEAATESLHYKISEFKQYTKIFHQSKEKAKALNDREKKSSTEKGTEINTSYSVRSNGDIIIYKKIENLWKESGKLTDLNEMPAINN